MHKTILYRLFCHIFSRGTRAQHLTLCVCVVCGVWCVVCGVPWMDAMLRSVREERQLYSHNQCVQYSTCVHTAVGTT